MSLSARASHDPAILDAALAASPNLALDYMPGVERHLCVGMHREQALSKLDSGGNLFTSNLDGEASALLFGDAPWDSEIYGMRMGRILAAFGAQGASALPSRSDAVRQLMAHVQDVGYDFVDMQVHVADVATLHALEDAGFRITGTNLSLVWDLSLPPAAMPQTPASIETASASDLEALGVMAQRSIPGHSRFVDDPQLPRGRAMDVIREWALNSVRGYADHVVLARLEGEIAGYCTWKIHRDSGRLLGGKLAALDLTAVAPEARRMNVLSAMAHAGLEWARAEGCVGAEVWTHVLNTGMQRACGVTLGARTLSARHSFHWHKSRA